MALTSHRSRSSSPLAASALALLALLAPSASASFLDNPLSTLAVPALPDTAIAALSSLGTIPSLLLSSRPSSSSASASNAAASTGASSLLSPAADPVQTCVDQITNWAFDAKYWPLGGLKMIDSWGKVPSDVMDNGYKALGSRSECFSANATAGFQYGVLYSSVAFQGYSIPIYWGVCVPSVCTDTTTPAALSIFLDDTASAYDQTVPASILKAIAAGSISLSTAEIPSDPASICAAEISKWALTSEFQSQGGLKMIDAWGKVPSDILDNGYKALGSRAECYSANATAGFQYGVLYASLPYKGINAPIYWGVCVPSFCESSYTPAALSIFLAQVALSRDQAIPSSVLNAISNGTITLAAADTPVVDPARICAYEIEKWILTTEYQSYGGLKLLDSWGKVPSAVLDGGYKTLGSITECYRVNDTAGFHYGVLSTSYVYLNKSIPVQWGVCVPSICDGSSTPGALAIFLAEVSESREIALPGSILAAVAKGTMRFAEPTPWTTGRIVMVSIFGSLLALTVLSTLLTRLYEYLDERELRQHAETDGVTSGEESAPLMANQDGAGRRNNVRIASPSRTSTWRSLVQSFDLYSNLVKLFAPFSGPHPTTAVLDGIRVLSMFWVILGHSNLWALTSGMDNYPDIEGVLNSFTFQIVLNAYYSVDTFFFLSGFLVAYMAILTLEKSPKFNYFLYILVRILRLTPTYMLVLFSYWHLHGFFGWGPFWASRNVNRNCEDFWWTNLLYINNFKPGAVFKECMGWTWYLANDTQFYLVAPLFFLPLVAKGRVRYLSFFFAIAGILTHLISAGVISYENNLPVTPIPSNKSNGYDGLIYVKPYSRIAPYIFGMICAQVYLMGSEWLGLPGYSLKNKPRLPTNNGHVSNSVNDAPESPTAIKAANKAAAPRFFTWKNIGLWLLSFGICASLIFSFVDLKIGTATIDPTYQYPWSRTVSALYNAISRPLWGVALTIVTYLLLTGRGGVLTSFLSHGFWAAPARLTYAAYLVHEPIVDVFYGNQNTVFHYHGTIIAYVFAGSVVIAYLVAFGIYMLAEAPLMGVVKILVGKISRPSKKV